MVDAYDISEEFLRTPGLVLLVIRKVANSFSEISEVEQMKYQTSSFGFIMKTFVK